MARERVCNMERMNIERMIAQALVIGGGLFWVAAAYTGRFAFQGASVLESVGSAAYPLIATVVVFAVGWWSERAASVLLYAMSAGVLGWGLIVGWEPVVWLVMMSVLFVPMLIAGIAYHLAANMDRVCAVSPGPVGVLRS